MFSLRSSTTFFNTLRLSVVLVQLFSVRILLQMVVTEADYLQYRVVESCLVLVVEEGVLGKVVEVLDGHQMRDIGLIVVVYQDDLMNVPSFSSMVTVLCRVFTLESNEAYVGIEAFTKSFIVWKFIRNIFHRYCGLLTFISK